MIMGSSPVVFDHGCGMVRRDQTHSSQLPCRLEVIIFYQQKQPIENNPQRLEEIFPSYPADPAE